MQSYLLCKLHVVAVAADSWEQVAHGEHHFTPFFPKKLLFQFPGLVQKCRGLAVFFPAQVNPLVRSHWALKWVPKNCATNHPIWILLGFLSRKGTGREKLPQSTARDNPKWWEHPTTSQARRGLVGCGSNTKYISPFTLIYPTSKQCPGLDSKGHHRIPLIAVMQRQFWRCLL